MLLFLANMHHTVLLFTGHLLDSMDRISSRFPYRLISEVRRMIAGEIKSFQHTQEHQIAISSLAAGSDILFAEAALDAGIKRFDSALKGIGGCPMANDILVGNMDTEQMIALFHEKNLIRPLNMEALHHASMIADEIFIPS